MARTGAVVDRIYFCLHGRFDDRLRSDRATGTSTGGRRAPSPGPRRGRAELIGCVVDVNVASAKILERFGFKEIEKFVSDDISLPETKYELIL